MTRHIIAPIRYRTESTGFKVAFTVALVTAITACASAPNLSDAGARLQAVSTDQAKACKFVRVVQFNDRILGMGKAPTVMRAIGETNLRNAVAATGADTFVVTRDDSNWFMGSVSYEAQAYRCGG